MALFDIIYLDEGNNMGITYIRIQNYKSIKDVYLRLSEINALLGSNGSGKSNIISAIKFFYDNLNKVNGNVSDDIFDIHNPYNSQVKISVGYDMQKLRKRCNENRRKQTEQKYDSFYSKVLALSDSNYFEVTMVIVKNDKIYWSKSYSERKLIYNLYPIYLIDTRKIDLTDWENLWFQIGDLSKLETNIRNEFVDEIVGVIKRYNPASKVYKKIEELFTENSIRIKRYSPRQLASQVARIYFGGHEFEFNDNKLVFFSNGTNTLNYIRAFVQILSILTEMKMKEPVLVIDEPEISLHHNYIDYLSDVIFNNNRNMFFVLSTHSSRLIKNILVRNSGNCFVYHMKMQDLYTHTKKMKLITDGREKVQITDLHANSYFAKMIVCVEGVTEVELLQNPFLKLVYPILNYIDIARVMTQDIEKHVISAAERQHGVPMLYTIDMDKVLNYDTQRKLFNYKDTFKHKDLYSFTVRRRNILGMRKRISAMSSNCIFGHRMPVYYSSDSNFKEFISLIKTYYLKYDYFVMQTTIEGMLINSFNLNTFIVYLRRYENLESERWAKVDNIMQQARQQERLNIIRILCDGKCDFLMNVKELRKKNPRITSAVNDLYNILDNKLVTKTNGWVSRWMEYSVCKVAGVVPFQSNSYQKVRTCMQNNGEFIRGMFSMHFNELDSWIKEISLRYNS